MANRSDPDQLASEEANWSGSTLFAKTGHSGLSRTRVNVFVQVLYCSLNLFTNSQCLSELFL